METVALTETAQALETSVTSAVEAALKGVSTDSRTTAPGELFFAIRGELHDGHDFVGAAFERGAAAAVVSEDSTVVEEFHDRPLLVVKDTTDALRRLAAWYRNRLDIRVVAVTGTNGKTTTKDMTAAVLSTSMRTAKTRGNFNNHIGVPLTLFALDESDEAAVVEIGMNHAGEIERLAAAVRPFAGVITNVAEAHMESMHDLESTARAKGELLDALSAEGVAILNGDDARVMSQAHRARCRVFTFGLSADSGVRASSVREVGGRVTFDVTGDTGVAGPVEVELPIPGRHNVSNALAAIAAGRALGVDAARAAEGLRCFDASPMRMRVSRRGEWLILNDAYNCNPGSLRAALDTLVSMAEGRRTMAALGDMLELGEMSADAHREAGRRVAEMKLDRLFLYGSEVEAMRDGALEGGMSPASVMLFDEKDELALALQDEPDEPTVLLVKGSRGMRMEEVVELLT